MNKTNHWSSQDSAFSLSESIARIKKIGDPYEVLKELILADNMLVKRLLPKNGIIDYILEIQRTWATNNEIIKKCNEMRKNLVDMYKNDREFTTSHGDKTNDFVVTRSHTRPQVYSGKTKNAIIPTLKELCLRYILANLHSYKKISSFSDELLQEFLLRCSVEQVKVIELNEPNICSRSDQIWKKYCQELKRSNALPKDYPNWRSYYQKLVEDKNVRLEQLSSKIKKREISQPKQRLAVVGNTLTVKRQKMSPCVIVNDAKSKTVVEQDNKKRPPITKEFKKVMKMFKEQKMKRRRN